MPDRMLQNHYCVAALQQPLSYNDIMSLLANEKSNKPTASTRWAGPRRARARWSCRTDLIVGMLLGTIVLASACGGGPATKPPGSPANLANPASHALAWVNCMRTHGEPNMPDIAVNGTNVSVNIQAGSGVDPHSPQFTAAFKACRHLLRGEKSGAAGGTTISPADQAAYLKAVACMRAHGYPKFPEPVFQGNNVSFNTTTPIDTKSPQYQRAANTCDKLIPAGLPYSGRTPAS
jgi:hypothetical protein